MSLENETTVSEGFTAEESAAFEAMKAGAPPPEASQEQPAAPPEAAKPAEPAQQPEKDRGDLGAALRQEREARKAIEQRLRESEERWARLDERTRPHPQQRQPDPPPDPYQDPTGYMLHKEQAYGQEISGLRQQLQGMTQQQQQRALEQAVFQDYSADASRFKAENADFDDAYKHYQTTRNAELAAGGMTDAQQRNAHIVREELQMAYQARQRGLSPAEYVYNLAKARGYAPKPAEAAPADPAAKIDQVAKTQQQNRSLQSAEGKGATEVTASVLAAMPDDEFEAWKNKNPAKFRQLMGSFR